MRPLSRPTAVLAIIGVAGALLLALVIPVSNQHAAAEKRLAMLREQAGLIADRADILMRMSRRSGTIEEPRAGTLFAEMDDIAGRLGLLEKIISMKPSTLEEQGVSYERVSITASGLYQENGIALLHAVEKQRRRIHIEQLTIRRSGGGLWEIALTVRRQS